MSKEIDHSSVTIAKTFFDELYAAREKLIKLEAWGVDNWEGYAEALADDEDETYEEIYGTTE
jgi:hypothetical protein